MILEESKASTLITQFLVHISDSGVGMHNKSDLVKRPLSHDEAMSLRDEFIAQLNKPAEDKPAPVLIAIYSSMEYGGHEVQMKHPGARLEIEDGKFYVYERQ